MAQNDRELPDWFDFEQRQDHDLDNVAQRFVEARLSRWEEDERLDEEYRREDRYWGIIYYSYELFKSQYNACVEWLLATRRRGADTESTFISKPAPHLNHLMKLSNVSRTETNAAAFVVAKPERTC